MKFDLSFWRFVVIFSVSKTWLWEKNNDVFLFHVGTFSNECNTALRVVVFPFSLMVGFIRKEQV